MKTDNHNRTSGFLQPEDYLEPSCVLCGEAYGVQTEIKPVPQQRIREKADEYMARRDYDGVERHLLYWLEEATLGRDLRGELMLRNELVGHYRKTGNREKAFENGNRALELLDLLDFYDSVSAGTTLINVATACQAFGENQRALTLFRRGQEIYEAREQTAPELLGGLYNNMALACSAAGTYAEARTLYEKAMEQMRQVPGSEAEQAITWLNRADILEAEFGMEEAESDIYACLDQAEALLNDPSLPHDGYYAFVCEKCAPAFSHYGYFAAAEELEKRARELYGQMAGNDKGEKL